MQEIFKMTPHDKQVMMFLATLSKEIQPVCKKFMQDVITPLLNFDSIVSFFYTVTLCGLFWCVPFVNGRNTYFWNFTCFLKLDSYLNNFLLDSCWCFAMYYF